MVFPTGDWSPKYLRAVVSERTVDSGLANTVAGSPATKGRRITCRKFGSTAATFSGNCRSATRIVADLRINRVRACTSGILSSMAWVAEKGILAEYQDGLPGKLEETSTR